MKSRRWLIRLALSFFPAIGLRPADPRIDVVVRRVEHHDGRFGRHCAVGLGLAPEGDDSVPTMVRIVVVVEATVAAQRR
jgi:hypothetical protein